MIRIEGLQKRYGRLQAVAGLDLEARPGEVLALLGPNGAGKSTTIKAIVGLVRPDAGRLTIAGLDALREPREARARLGYLPQRVAFHENLTALEVLAFFARLRGVSSGALRGLLARVGLADSADRRTRGFSGGMLQRLGLAVALLGEPQVLVLDEPTVGLDPEGALLFKEIVQERRAAGCTVLLSSHLLNEVQTFADRLAFCLAGRVTAQDTLAGLRERLGLPSRLALRLAEPPAFAPHALAEAGARAERFEDGWLHLRVAEGARERILALCLASGARVLDVRSESAGLEEIFLATLHRPSEASC